MSSAPACKPHWRSWTGQEQAYTELFLGKRVTTTSVERITVVPDAGKQKYILCRFSPDRGLLPATT